MDKAAFLSKVELALNSADSASNEMMLSYCRTQIESLGPGREAEAISALGSPERMINAFNMLLQKQSEPVEKSDTTLGANSSGMPRSNAPYAANPTLTASPYSPTAYAPHKIVFAADAAILDKPTPTKEPSSTHAPLYASVTQQAPTTTQPAPEWSSLPKASLIEKSITPPPHSLPALSVPRQASHQSASPPAINPEPPARTEHKTRVIRPLYPANSPLKNTVPHKITESDIPHTNVSPFIGASPIRMQAPAPPPYLTQDTASQIPAPTPQNFTPPTAPTKIATSNFAAFNNNAPAITPPAQIKTIHAIYTAEPSGVSGGSASPSRLFPAVDGTSSSALLGHQSLVAASPIAPMDNKNEYYATPKLAPLEEEGSSPYTPPPRLLEPKGPTGIMGFMGSTPEEGNSEELPENRESGKKTRKPRWPFKKARQAEEESSATPHEQGPRLSTNGLYANETSEPADKPPPKAFFVGKTRTSAVAYALLGILLMLLALAVALLALFVIASSASIISFCFALMGVSVAQGLTSLGLGLILFVVGALLFGLSLWCMYRLFLGLLQNISTAFPESPKKTKPLLKEDEEQ